MITQSDTPRTDTAVNDIGRSGVDWHHSAAQMAVFAKQLERELTVTIANRDALKLKCAKMQSALERADIHFSPFSQSEIAVIIREALK